MNEYGVLLNSYSSVVIATIRHKLNSYLLSLVFLQYKSVLVDVNSVIKLSKNTFVYNMQVLFLWFC